MGSTGLGAGNLAEGRKGVRWGEQDSPVFFVSVEIKGVTEIVSSLE